MPMLTTQLLSFSPPQARPNVHTPASAPPPLPSARARFVASGVRAGAGSGSGVGDVDSTSPGAFVGSASDWILTAAEFVREVAVAEAEVDALLRARLEANVGGVVGGDLPWSELHSMLAQTTRVAETERMLFSTELAMLRTAARTNNGAPPASAVRAQRENARRSFGVLRAEERAIESALGARAHVDAMAAAVVAERARALRTTNVRPSLVVPGGGGKRNQ